MDELEYFSKRALLRKAKEMGLQGYSTKNKEELIELIKKPPPPRARHIGVRKKVTLQSTDSEGDELVFPSISAAAKHFNVNPSVFAAKLRARKESIRNFITLEGRKFALHFEAYRLKE